MGAFWKAQSLLFDSRFQVHQILTCRIFSANSSPVRLLRESLLAYCQLRSKKPSVFCFFHILIGPNCTPDPPSGSRQRRPSRRNRPRRRRNRPRRRRRSRRRHRSQHHHRSRHHHQNQRLHRSLDLLRRGRGVGWVNFHGQDFQYWQAPPPPGSVCEGGHAVGICVFSPLSKAHRL